MSRALPVYAQHAAWHMYFDIVGQQSEIMTDDGRCAGTGSTGTRLTGTALVHPQVDPTRIDDLHEANVDLPREQR